MLLYFSLTALSLVLTRVRTGFSTIVLLTLLLWLLIVAKLLNVSSHTLLVLLILEFFMLLFLLLLLSLKSSFFSRSNLVLTFFTLAVCEASLGLGLLISVSRKYGSQLLVSLLAFKLKKLSTFKVGYTT